MIAAQLQAVVDFGAGVQSHLQNTGTQSTGASSEHTFVSLEMGKLCVIFQLELNSRGCGVAVNCHMAQAGRECTAVPLWALDVLAQACWRRWVKSCDTVAVGATNQHGWCHSCAGWHAIC